MKVSLTSDGVFNIRLQPKDAIDQAFVAHFQQAAARGQAIKVSGSGDVLDFGIEKECRAPVKLEE